MNARTGQARSARRLAGDRAARRQAAAARSANPATEIPSSTVDSTGQPAWRSPPDTIPVAITIAKLPRSAPCASRAKASATLAGARFISPSYRDTI